MPRFKFEKLVRDRIVEHQLKSGAKPKYRQLDKDEHVSELIKKLIEEAREVLSAEKKDLASEIADVQQALDDLIDQSNLSQEEISVQKKLKKQKNGAFKKGIYIDYVDLDDDDPFINYFRQNQDRYPEISETSEA